MNENAELEILITSIDGLDNFDASELKSALV